MSEQEPTGCGDRGDRTAEEVLPPIPGYENGYLTLRGVCIRYQTCPGTGTPLVVLQGGMIDSPRLTWKYTLQALAGRHHVLAPDPPGYGASDKPTDAPYDTEYYVDFLEDFLEAMGIDRIVLFGSSMGGAVALAFALRHPARVRALVLNGAFGFQERVLFHEAVYAAARIPGIDTIVRRLLRGFPFLLRLAFPIAVHGFAHVNEELLRDARVGLRRKAALHAFVRWMRTDILPHHVRSCYLDVLDRLHMPVLLLHGEHDVMMPVGATRRAAGLLPDAELHVFEDASHLVPREFPEAANRIILDFLDRLPA